MATMTIGVAVLNLRRMFSSWAVADENWRIVERHRLSRWKFASFFS